MFITKFGTVWGQVPFVTGRHWFVSPSDSYTVENRTYSASDDNKGDSPENALRTINRAIDLATADAGEIIVLLSGTHTSAATIDVDKAGLTILGAASIPGHFPLNAKSSRTVVTISIADELFNITASNVELGYFTARGVTAQSVFSFQTTSALDGLYFHDLITDVSNVNASLETRGLDFGNRSGGTGAARLSSTPGVATAYVERCTFLSSGAQGEAVNISTAHVHMVDCRIHGLVGTWASPFICASGCDNTLLDRVVWTTSGTMSMALTGTGSGAPSAANAVCLVNCRFQMSTDIDLFTGVGPTLDTITSYEPTSGGTLSVIG